MSLSGMSARPPVSVLIFGFFCGLMMRCRPRPLGPTYSTLNLSPMERLQGVSLDFTPAGLPVRAKSQNQGHGMDDVMAVRPAQAADIDHLARLWHQGWNDAHGTLAPQGLVRARTLESFRERLVAALADTRVGGPVGQPSGLCMIKN